MGRNTIKCYGVTNCFNENPDLRIFFNEYDNFYLFYVEQEAKELSERFGIDVYIFKSSENHFHLLSFDLLNKEELKHIINFCTNDGDYLYNFLTNNFEYVLRISDKEGNKIEFVKAFFAKNNIHHASLQHIRSYTFFTGYKLPYPTCKIFDNLNIKFCVYRTFKRSVPESEKKFGNKYPVIVGHILNWNKFKCKLIRKKKSGEWWD